MSTRWQTYNVGDKLAELLRAAGTDEFGHPFITLSALADRFAAVHAPLAQTLGYPLVKEQAGTRGPTRTLYQYILDNLRSDPHPQIELAGVHLSGRSQSIMRVVRYREAPVEEA